MSKRLSAFSHYLTASRSIHYSLLLTLPLLLIYEWGIFFAFRSQHYEMRNSGEVLLRSVLDYLGLSDPQIMGGVLFVLFLVIMIRGYLTERNPGYQANTFLIMLLEAPAWGVVLYVLLEGFSRLPLQLLTLNEKFINIHLALGAGIFEELIFRMVLIGGLMVFLKLITDRRGVRLESLAILLAAVGFAAFHLIVESFYVPLFMQRVLGGIFLGYVFQYRGYGIAVFTHVTYNLLVLSESW